MLRKRIIAATGIDRQNQNISASELANVAEYLTENPQSVRMSVNHDITVLPMGKVIGAKLIETPDETVLEALIDEFVYEFDKVMGPDGTVIFCGQSKIDCRPFVQYGESSSNNLSFSLNPIHFSEEEFMAVMDEFQEYGIEIKTTIQKAWSPGIEVLIITVKGVLIYLITKKTLDKLADEVSSDIVKCYSLIKKGIMSLFRKFSKHKEKTLILSEPDQPIELIVRSKDAETVMIAFEKLSESSILELVQKYESFLNDEIDKIQFIYTDKNKNWKLNYLTTKSGKSIGTYECYKQAVHMYEKTMASPTAGFSFNGSVEIETEKMPND